MEQSKVCELHDFRTEDIPHQLTNEGISRGERLEVVVKAGACPVRSVR